MPAFGEFLNQADKHIAAATAIGGALPEAAGRPAVNELQRLVTTLARYLADVTWPAGYYSAAGNPLNPELRAVLDARLALRRAASSLQPAEQADQESAHDVHPAVRHLSAAASHLAAGRDLLQTHFLATPARPARNSDWAPAITSRPLTVPLLSQLGTYAQQLAAWTAQLSEPATASASLPPETRRALQNASWWLSAAGTNLHIPQQLHPAPPDGRRLLAAIPPNFPPPRQPPGDAEPVPRLCDGITATAERLTHVALTFASQARWSPAANSLSWRRDALASAITSHSSEVILRTLAIRAHRLGIPATTRPQLRSAADTISRAWPAWRDIAHQWDIYSTGTHKPQDISPVAIELGDLVLWTGRLAYHPQWTPAPADASRARPPADLAPSTRDLRAALRAIQQSADAISRIMTADTQAIRAAAADHRLYTPTRLLPEQYDFPGPYSPVPPELAGELLAAYDKANEMTLHAVKAMNELAMAIGAPGSALEAARSAAVRPTNVNHLTTNHSKQDQPNAGRLHYTPPPQPGPMERILAGLQITESTMLIRAAAIDDAARDLLEQSAATARKRDLLRVLPRRRTRHTSGHPARTAAKDLPTSLKPDLLPGLTVHQPAAFFQQGHGKSLRNGQAS